MIKISTKIRCFYLLLKASQLLKEISQEFTNYLSYRKIRTTWQKFHSKIFVPKSNWLLLVTYSTHSKKSSKFVNKFLSYPVQTQADTDKHWQNHNILSSYNIAKKHYATESGNSGTHTSGGGTGVWSLSPFNRSEYEV